MKKELRVKDVMVPIGEYDTVNVEARLNEVLAALKARSEAEKAGRGVFRKTVFVTGARGEIVGIVSAWHLLRGLVPDEAKNRTSQAVKHVLTLRAEEVAGEISEIQERFQWLEHDFADLVGREAQKRVRDVMGPVKAVLKEDDTLNWALYTMFHEDAFEPLVMKDGRAVGVLNHGALTRALLDVALP